jgi:hypothetical protein
MTFWKPGRRMFSTAALLMILTAAAHTAGNLASSPENPEEQKLFAAMSAFHEALGMGMNPSMQDIYWTLVFTMSITFAALGAINLSLAASADVSDGVLRRVSWVNLLWVGVFLVLSWKHQIPPPLISAVVIEFFVVASLLRRATAVSPLTARR